MNTPHGFDKHMMKRLLMASVGALTIAGASPALAQNFSVGSSSFSVKPPTVTYTPPPPPPPTYTPPPPPTIPPPPPVNTPPPVMHIPALPPQQSQLPPINQMDLSSHNQLSALPEQNAGALAGIQTLSENDFPSADDAGGSPDWLLIRSRFGSEVHRVSTYVAKLEYGQIVASVRRPTKLAFVLVDGVNIALTADADVMVTTENNVTRVANLDGRGQTVKIKVDAKLISGQSAKVLALAPGYELVVANHKLQGNEVRIADGCARRHFKLLEDGKMSVCEICSESVVTSSQLVAEMARQPTEKEKRVLSDMSKMAAVLNYINGTEGFTVEAPPVTQLAHQQ